MPSHSPRVASGNIDNNHALFQGRDLSVYDSIIIFQQVDKVLSFLIQGVPDESCYIYGISNLKENEQAEKLSR